MTTKRETAEREQAIADLRELLPAGTDVYVVQRRVSRSGLQCRLTLHVIDDKHASEQAHYTDLSARDFRLRDITYVAAVALGCPVRDGELVVNGIGMDMHFHTVYSLSSALFPDSERGGYALNTVSI